MTPTQIRLPADNPQTLKEQLLRELGRLTRATGEPDIQEPWLYQVYLEKFLIEAWMQVSTGNFEAPREYLRHLAEAEDLVKPFVPSPVTTQPYTQAARDVQDLIRTLEVADRCLTIRRSKARSIERQRSEAEIEVLRVLSEYSGRYLRRGEIYEQMSVRPTPGRVSQILSALDGEGLLIRIQAPAQGNSVTSFFALSEGGRELCRTLGISPTIIHFERSGRPWRDLLRQPEAVAIGEDLSPGCIAAFYGHRRGIGRSLALAHSAQKLAKELADKDKSVLVIDLTFEASELPDYLGTTDFDCLGLRGLLDEYRAQPPEHRRTWLQNALLNPRYVKRPSTRLQNLYFLPLGIDPAELQTANELTERLLREIGHASRRHDNAPAKAEGGFFGDLREALISNFGKVLIDTAANLGPVAYAGTTLLPDELILFLRPNERDFNSPRTVLGNFLWRESANGRCRFAPVTFIFSIRPIIPSMDLRRTVDVLLGHDKQRRSQYFYRILSLFYSPEVAQGDCLVNEEGSWIRYPKEDLLTSGYESLSATLLRPPSAVNWRIRVKQMERKRTDAIDAAARRPSELGRMTKSTNEPLGKTPPGSAYLQKTIRAAEASHGTK